MLKESKPKHRVESSTTGMAIYLYVVQTTQNENRRAAERRMRNRDKMILDVKEKRHHY